MKKRIFSLFLMLSILFAGVLPAHATTPATAPVAETAPLLYANGAVVSNACATQEAGVTYVMAYYVVLALHPETQVSWGQGRTYLTGDGFTLSLRAGDAYLICNDRYLYLPGLVRSHPETGGLMVPVRSLATALGAEVGWDAVSVTLTLTGTPLESGANFYNAQDLDLLARVITHESRNESLEGKIAVANVILNRVASPLFPNTIEAVLNQKNQFPGATRATPTESAILAAKLALDGAVTAPSACWFNGAGKSCWASQNKTLIATIGNHAFYG